MSDRVSKALVVLAMGLVVASTATAQNQLVVQTQPAYSITDLGALGNFETLAYGINESTQVTGRSHVDANPGFVRHAFFWENGVMTDLGTLVDGGSAWAFDINENAFAVGYADDGTSVQPTLFLPGVAPMQLFLPGTGGEARGLNDNLEVVGYFVETLSGDIRPFIWVSTGAYVDLGAATAVGQGVGEEIGEGSQVVGWSFINGPCGGEGGLIGPGSTLWKTDASSPTGWKATALPNLPGFCFSHAYDININEEVVGTSGGITSDNPVLWRKGTKAWTVTYLGSLGGNGVAYGINNKREIVGESGGRAFHWQCDRMVDLNNRIPSGTGWFLMRANAINNRGEIVGFGRINGGPLRGFLLQPTGPRTVCAEPF